MKKTNLRRKTRSVNLAISLKPSHQNNPPQVIMRRKNVIGKQLRSHYVSGETWASCSLDQLQQGYLTPSPPHQWTHHIDGERLHQSNTKPQGTQAFRPLGKTLETVSKCNKISTNEHWVTAHFVCRNKKRNVQTPCWYRWVLFPSHA